MTKNINYKISLLLILLVSYTISLQAQDEEDTSKPSLSLNIHYHTQNNKMMYILADAKAKINGKFMPQKGIAIKLYLDSDSFLINKLVTDKNGMVKTFLSPNLKAQWDAAHTHTIQAVSEATKTFEEATGEVTITKSKIVLDTITEDSIRTITAKILVYDGKDWIEKKDVEMKLGIVRAGGGILSVGEEATYTTDSTGMISAEFKRDSLPGDVKGNIILIAKVEDNDELGNIQVEKIVPWGIAVKQDNSFFNQRTLWSTRFRTPFWLLFMAYSIVIGVWGTVIYLVTQIIKIKKLGTA